VTSNPPYKLLVVGVYLLYVEDRRLRIKREKSVVTAIVIILKIQEIQPSINMKMKDPAWPSLPGPLLTAYNAPDIPMAIQTQC
jgi:hypothetical protein